MEIWKDINNYKGIYQVSNLGNVKSMKTGKLIKPFNNKGHKRVSLFKDGKTRGYQVHRLVLEAFKPITVNHIDGNKANNELSNLEWLSIGDNIRHAIRIGLRNDKGSAHHMSKLTDEDVLKIRQMHAEGVDRHIIKDMYTVTLRQIERIIYRESWTHI